MNEIVIKENGEVVKRCATETPIDLMPGIELIFAANATFKLKQVVDFSQLGEPFFGPASLMTATGTPGAIWWSVQVKTLNLHTTFELLKEKDDTILVPTFKNDGKFIEIPWRPPPSMTILLGVNTEMNRGLQYPGKRILVAHDSDRVTWRLPLPNLHDNLELCHGQERVGYPTAFKALQVSLAQFKASKWNADLYHPFQSANAPELFRFKPLNEGFEQVPVENWKIHCIKTGNSFITNNLLHL